MAARVHLLALWLVAGAIVAATPAVAQSRGINLFDFVMRIGDDPSWADPDLDESGWEPVRLHQVPDVDAIVWLRTRVELRPSDIEQGRPLGIYFAAIASHEIWWDGERIGAGGIVGSDPESERPGPIEAHYVIPERLASPGTHRLAIRTSAFHRHFTPFTGFWTVYVGDYDRITSVGSRDVGIALIGLSGIVMIGAFALLIFLLDDRDRSFLFLGLMCVAGAALLIAESWRSLFGYTYDWHIFRLVLVTALAFLMDLFLLVFLARRFPMSGASWFVAAGIAAAAIPIVVTHAWDPKVQFGFLGVFSLSVAWCARAAIHRMHGSLLALLGVGCCLAGLLAQPFRFVDRWLYLSLNVLLMCLLASHVLQVRRQRKERDAALLKSARLEIELLKRHIQPHFLLNTLTALSEWVETQPAIAARMIHALADEFRVLSEISNRRLIRMEDEIRLCRSHLDIMSHRKRCTYRLTTDNVDSDAMIPPAVIHTLVENAITHHEGTVEEVEFQLSEECVDGVRRYVFSAPMERSGTESCREGTGVRYIRARLQESFGERFGFSSGAEAGRWRTEIRVPVGT